MRIKSGFVQAVWPHATQIKEISHIKELLAGLRNDPPNKNQPQIESNFFWKMKSL
jgi:hypothetical protein